MLFIDSLVATKNIINFTQKHHTHYLYFDLQLFFCHFDNNFYIYLIQIHILASRPNGLASNGSYPLKWSLDLFFLIQNFRCIYVRLVFIAVFILLKCIILMSLAFYWDFVVVTNILMSLWLQQNALILSHRIESVNAPNSNCQSSSILFRFEYIFFPKMVLKHFHVTQNYIFIESSWRKNPTFLFFIFRLEYTFNLSLSCLHGRWKGSLFTFITLRHW